MKKFTVVDKYITSFLFMFKRYFIIVEADKKKFQLEVDSKEYKETFPQQEMLLHTIQIGNIELPLPENSVTWYYDSVKNLYFYEYSIFSK